MSTDFCTFAGAHIFFTRVFLRNSHQWKFYFLLNSPSFRITRHSHSCIYTVVLIVGIYLACFTALRKPCMSLSCFLDVCVCVCVCVCVLVLVYQLTLVVWELKSVMQKKKKNFETWTPYLFYRKSRNFVMYGGYEDSCLIEKFTATCILLSVCFIYIYVLFSWDLTHLMSHR